MKKLLAVLLVLASTAYADSLGVVVSKSGAVIAKEVYAGDTSSVSSSLASRQQADPTLSFTTSALPDAGFDATVVPINQTPLRTTAVALIASDPQPIGKVQRAAALVVLDRVNAIHEWLMSFQAQVALSSSLANMQTRVAALPAMPDFNAAQIKTAIQNKINQGDAD